MNNNRNFTHLLITRFNVDYSHFADAEYICDDEWHEERFGLFNFFCLPSVARQTRQTFKWLIFFNEEKREQYRDFLENTKRGMAAIEFIFVKPVEKHKELLTEYIRENVTTEYLITTRMDNDDCIANHFIESIQKKFSEMKEALNESDMIINAGNGYQFETIFPYRKSRITGYKYSPFLSLVSKTDRSNPVNTVLNHQHLQWKNYLDSVELSDEPLWAQVIHKKNLANRILSLKLQPGISDPNFPELQDVSNNILWTGRLMLPLQFLITTVRRVAEKIRKLK